MDSDTKTKIKFIILFLLIITFILIIILISVGIAILEYDEVGILYNTYFKTLDDNNKYKTDTGRFFVGIYGKFIKFPKYYDSIEFSDEKVDNKTTADASMLSCSTLEGIEITLEISYYYTLNHDKLMELYLNFGENWKDVLIKVSIESIKNTSTKIRIITFFEDRNYVSSQIKTNLQLDFNNLLNDIVRIELLQLRRIVFSSQLETALNYKLIQKHNKKLFEIRGQIYNITNTTGLLIAQAKSKIKLINAKYIGEGKKQNNILLSAALKDYMVSLNDIYYYLKTGAGIISNNNLLKIMYAMELKNMDLNNKLVQFVPNGIISVFSDGVVEPYYNEEYLTTNIQIKVEGNSTDYNQTNNNTTGQI